MTPDALPPNAITNAAEAVAIELRKMPGKRDERAEENILRLAFDLAVTALEAAAPHLAAAEREACAQLAEQHNALYLVRGDPQPDGEPSGMMPFAALLRKDPNAAT